MTKQIKIIYGLLLIIIVARIFAMVTLPLTDTTEARYAHTAYLMATTNDWITPYFDIGVPFWAKPPFSFWAEAFSYKIFGLHDFSARIPAIIFTLLTLLCIFKYLKTFYTESTALWGILVYSTFLLTYALSGAVLTDPYLAFSTTLSMISFIMIVKNREIYWQYLFFIGISIGLLAKGPLTLVLIGGAIVFWILFDFKNRIKELKKLFWIRGTILTTILVVPWYIIAELKTPGFLNYFIVGEHFKRFLDPGWSGDLYGAAHKRPYGMIWLMWIEASFPWGLLAFYALFKNNNSKRKLSDMVKGLKQNSEISYFIMWSLFTMIFFSPAANTLWTYILPALSSLAILIAIYLQQVDYKLMFKKFNLVYLFTLTVPIVLIIANLYLMVYTNILPTEKYLLAKYQSLSSKNTKIYYMYKRPFSAQYYSNDKAILVLSKRDTKKHYSNSISSRDFLQTILHNGEKKFIAIPKNKLKRISDEIKKPLKKIFESKKFILFKI